MIPQQTPDWPCSRFSYFICPNGARKRYQCTGNRGMSSLVLSALFDSVCRESWQSGEESELCVQPTSKVFGVWPDLQNLIVCLHCVLQYLGDLRSGSPMSLLGAWLLQTFPLNECTAFMLTVQRPVSPHSLAWWSFTCLVVQRQTWREAELLCWSAQSCPEACFSLGYWYQFLLT